MSSPSTELNILPGDRISSINGASRLLTAEYRPNRRNVSCYSKNFEKYLLEHSISQEAFKNDVLYKGPLNLYERFMSMTDIQVVKVRIG
jgi:hypothetical protein